MSLPEVDPAEAHVRMGDGSGVVYIDVRSVPEFEAGHPEGAINIPLFHLDLVTQQLEPNPDFLAVVTANVSKETPVICGCQMGGRSAKAVLALIDAGYENVVNLRGGFGGARNESGEIVVPGWQQADLPVSDDDGPGVSYESLSARKNA